MGFWVLEIDTIGDLCGVGGKNTVDARPKEEELPSGSHDDFFFLKREEKSKSFL